MRPADNINDLIKKLQLKASAALDTRVHDKISAALAESEKTKSVHAEPTIWRKTVKSSTTRIAAAALIIIGVFIGICHFGGPNVAWAEVAQRLEDIKTVAYKITADIKGMPGMPGMSGTPEGYTTHITLDVKHSYEQRAGRIDSSYQVPGGTKKTHTYALFEDSIVVTLIPSQKKYSEVAISDEQMKKMEEEKGDPVTLLNAMLEHDYAELGRKEINGVMASGIEVSDPKLSAKMGSFISGTMFDETIVQLWVDEKNRLPIRIDATGSSHDGQISMEVVYDGFQWDIPIAPALLKPEIPDDYELMAQGNWDGGSEGEDIIDVLRLFVEFADGKYPASLKLMTVAKAIIPALRKKFPLGSPLPSKELLARLTKVDMVGITYATLEKDGKDPAYYGDKVSAESPDAVLFRWKVSDDTYRVVFGDLRTEDVSAEKLAELENLQR